MILSAWIYALFKNKVFKGGPSTNSSNIKENLLFSIIFSGINNFFVVPQLDKSGGKNIASIAILYKI